MPGYKSVTSMPNTEFIVGELGTVTPRTSFIAMMTKNFDKNYILNFLISLTI